MVHDDYVANFISVILRGCRGAKPQRTTFHCCVVHPAAEYYDTHELPLQQHQHQPVHQRKINFHGASTHLFPDGSAHGDHEEVSAVGEPVSDGQRLLQLCPPHLPIGGKPVLQAAEQQGVD